MKYVAKKSKAGFDKVHEELYRFYSESFSKADKSVQQSSNDQHRHNTYQDKGRSSSRKWSTYGRFWSSTGYSKPMGQSFISYLPENCEDLGSSTSSDKTDMSFPMLSDEYDLIKQENKALHIDGTCSASLIETDKTLFDFDRYRYSMPHSELTKDVVYANDRVLHVEALTNSSKLNEEEDDFSAIYAVPNYQNEQQNSHKNGDYIYMNLQTLYTENREENTQIGTNNSKDLEIKPLKDNQVSDIPEACKTNVMNLGSSDGRSIQQGPVVSNVNKAKIGDAAPVGDVTIDEDNDYLPPSEWSESKNSIPQEKSSKNKHPWTAKRQTNIGDETLHVHGCKPANIVRPNSDVDDEYVPVSSWLDPDYVNVPNGKKNPVLYECLGNKNFASKLPDGTSQIVDSGELKDEERFDESDYDRPTEWIHTYENCQKTTIDSCTDYLYAKVVKHVHTNSNDDVSVPGRLKVMTEVISDESLKTDSRIPNTHTSADTDKTHYVIEKADHASGDTEFYKYSVDEVVECLNFCALVQLAKVCQEEKLDGEYFRGLTADDMKKQPFNMNRFFICKLFKVIEGWRPKEMP